MQKQKTNTLKLHVKHRGVGVKVAEDVGVRPRLGPSANYFRNMQNNMHSFVYNRAGPLQSLLGVPHQPSGALLLPDSGGDSVLHHAHDATPIHSAPEALLSEIPFTLQRLGEKTYASM